MVKNHTFKKLFFVLALIVVVSINNVVISNAENKNGTPHISVLVDDARDITGLETYEGTLSNEIYFYSILNYGSETSTIEYGKGELLKVTVDAGKVLSFSLENDNSMDTVINCYACDKETLLNGDMDNIFPMRKEIYNDSAEKKEYYIWICANSTEENITYNLNCYGDVSQLMSSATVVNGYGRYKGEMSEKRYSDRGMLVGNSYGALFKIPLKANEEVVVRGIGTYSFSDSVLYEESGDDLIKVSLHNNDLTDSWIPIKNNSGKEKNYYVWIRRNSNANESYVEIVVEKLQYVNEVEAEKVICDGRGYLPVKTDKASAYYYTADATSEYFSLSNIYYFDVPAKSECIVNGGWTSENESAAVSTWLLIINEDLVSEYVMTLMNNSAYPNEISDSYSIVNDSDKSKRYYIASAQLNNDKDIRFDVRVVNNVELSETNFPDSYFRKYLASKYDTDKDGIIDANLVRDICVCGDEEYSQSSTNYAKIKSLKGIELFPQLYYLDCKYTSINELDLSNNKKLETLYCGHTNLTELNVKNNIDLTGIYCNDAEITALDVSNNPKLTKLKCDGNRIKELDVSKNKELILLECSDNEISSLDVSNNPKLQTLYCANTKVSELELSNNTELISLDCDKTNIDSLNLNNNKKLAKIYCNTDGLSTLDLSNNNDVKILVIDYASLLSVDLKNALWDYESFPPEFGIHFFNAGYKVDLSKIKGLDFSGINDEAFDCKSNILDLKKLEFTKGNYPLYNYGGGGVIGSEPYTYENINGFYKWHPDGLDTPMYFYVLNNPGVNVYYRTHVQTFGWEGDKDNILTWKSNGAMSGTSGLAKRLEGINIVVNASEEGKTLDLGVQYTTHCQSYGWLPWSADGDMNGTEGEAKRLEAIMIKLTGDDAKQYDIYYRVHAQSYGWLNWAKNGEPAGTAGYAKRLEGIQIIVVKKGESFNQSMEGIDSIRTEAYIAKEGSSPIVNGTPTDNMAPTVPGSDMPNVVYRTHVQKYGWQAWKYNGTMSGTSGEAKRLEGIEINLTNTPYDGDIVYTTHVQKYGWQGNPDDLSRSGWSKNGEMSGTSGEAKRLEAICIDLTGEMAEKYDIYYRVHAQTFGWLGWAKNGECSGTAGYAKRLEGIQIVLVPKGGVAPDINYGGINSVDARAYVEK